MKAKEVIQDWTQAETAGFDRGRRNGLCHRGPGLFRELTNEDGVLAGESDQDDEADLGKNVVLHRAQPLRPRLS